MSDAKVVVSVLLEISDEVWTEVARGRTKEELLGQLRDYFLRDDEPVDDEEATGPPMVFMIHVEGEEEDEDQVLINYSLEDVATTAAATNDTSTSECEELEKEVIEISRFARNDTHTHNPSQPPLTLRGGALPEGETETQTQTPEYGALRKCA